MRASASGSFALSHIICGSVQVGAGIWQQVENTFSPQPARSASHSAVARWSVHMIVRRTGRNAASSSTALWVEPSRAQAATSFRSTPFAASFRRDARRAVHQSAGSCSLQPGRSWWVVYSVEASPTNEPSVPRAVTLHPPVP